jgi:tetratricopeptide (TPR) repeat protein
MLENDPKLNEQYLRARIDSTYRQASSALKHGDQHGALRSLTQTWEAAERLRDGRTIAMCSEAFGRIYDALGQGDTARRWFQVSVRHYEELARESFHLAYDSDDNDRWDAARILYTKTRELNEKIGDQGSVAADLFSLASICYAQGAKSEGFKLLRESGDVSIGFVNSNRGSGTNTVLGLLKSPHSLDQFERMRVTFTYLGDEGGEAFGLHGLGIKNLSEGKLDEARKLFERSLQISEQLKDEWGTADNHLWVGICAFFQGQLGEARERFESDQDRYRVELEVSKKLGDNKGMADSMVGIANILLWRATVAFEEGDSDEGHNLLEQSASYYEELVRPATIADALDEFARIARDQGNPEMAKRLEVRGREIVGMVGPSPFRSP